MRIAITGATGNVGTSLVRLLSTEPEVEEVVAIARRVPSLTLPRVRWAAADIARSELRPLFEGVDAVVHLAWAIQPSRRLPLLRAVNLDGSRRVFQAAAEARVGSIVYASSVGAYRGGAPGQRQDERWPATGVPTSFYSRHKAAVENLLDRFQTEHPQIRVVRMRPALTFKREAATGIRRLFLGPFFPGIGLRLPLPRTLRMQAVHTEDVADAYRRALLSDASGAFNLAAEPPLDTEAIARIMDTVPLAIDPGLARRVIDGAYRAHLHPTPPSWLDLALAVPLMDPGRARRQLGWRPRVSAGDALGELLTGLRTRADYPTPPLAASTTAPWRWRELATGVGRRSGLVERSA